MSTKKILIASDHAGIELKDAIQRLLRDCSWVDLGPKDTGRVDYPDYAATLSRKIAGHEADHGVLICGSGIGMSIAANKVNGVRAALAENPTSARLAKEHNHANVLCLGSRFLAPEYAAEIVLSWLQAVPSEDTRHLQRIQKITHLEKEEEKENENGSN